MIYSSQGVPLKQVLMQAALAREARSRYRKPALYDCDTQGNRLYRVLQDKLGKAYRVFRAVLSDTNCYTTQQLRAARAAKGVGRPPRK